MWIFFFFFGGGGGSSQNWTYLGVISMHFRVFSEGQCTKWGIFLGVAKISNTFLCCLELMVFFGMNSRCYARAYV